MKRALVLGGGGAVGIAWETAILAGLLDGGIDAREADLVIGTSAGSVVGARIAANRDPRELYDELRAEPERPPVERPAPDMAQLTAVFQLWASFDRMTPERCARVARLALEAKTMPEDAWVQGFVSQGFDGWPEKPLLVCAVDCESGQLAAFERNDGVPLARAIAASCAVPAMFPAVTINGRRYTDGGVCSGTSADLAQRIEPDVVLIVATMGTAERGIHVLAAKDIAREKAALESAGARVHVVMFDEATREAAGPNLMDPSRRLPAAEAGRAQGARIAPDLREFWGR